MNEKWDNLDNMDLWKTEQSFPAEEWANQETTGKFLSVNWDAHYHNVVNWVSERMREDWFAEQDGFVYEFATGWNFKGLEVFKPGLGRHVGSIKVNVPYESIINFNYLAVDLAPQPVPDHGVSRHTPYYYFITSLNKISPSTSEVFIELDSWTTYRPSIEIQALQANRGHFAHANTPADVFLANPLENHYGITEIEPDLPSVKSLVSNEQLISFQKSSPRILIATTADLTDSDALWMNTSDITNIHKETGKTTPSNNWWLNNIGSANNTNSLGHAGSAPVPAVGSSYTNGSGTGVRVYSIEPTMFNNFINTCRNKYPQLLKTIQAVYVLDSVLIDEGTEFTFSGFNFKPVQQQNSVKIIDEFKPTKDKFGYDAAYADFAKLYTNQFAVIEVSNMNGQMIEISVEDIAEGLEFYSRSATAFPFLKLEAFINGVGGKEKMTYAVKPWNNANAQLFKSSWEEYKFDIDVPVYGVFAEAGEIRGPDANAEAYKSINKASTNYTNNNNSINSDYTNAVNNAERNQANAANRYNTNFNNSVIDITRERTNATNDYTTAYNNAVSSADRSRSNATNSYTTAYNNSILSINRNRSNATNDYNTTYSNAVDSANRSRSNATDAYSTAYSNDIASINKGFTNTSDSISTDYSNSIAEAVAMDNIGTRMKNIADRMANTSYSNAITTNSLVKNISEYDIVRNYADSQTEINYVQSVGHATQDALLKEWKNVKNLTVENYESSRDINYYNLIVQLYQTLEQSKLEVAVNGMQMRSNMVKSSSSPQAMIGTAMDYQINDFETWKNHEINTYVMTQLYRVMNQGNITLYRTGTLSQQTAGTGNNTYTVPLGWISESDGPISKIGNGGQKAAIGFTGVNLSSMLGTANFTYNGLSDSQVRLKQAIGETVPTLQKDIDILTTEWKATVARQNSLYGASTKNIRDSNNATKSANDSIAVRTRDSELYAAIQERSNATDNENVVRSNALRTRNTDNDNNDRDKTVDTQIAGRNRSKSIDIADRDVSVDKAIALAIRNNSTTIANRDQSVDTDITENDRSKEIAIANRNVSVDKAIALAIRNNSETIAEYNKTVDTNIANAEKSKETTIANRDVSVDKGIALNRRTADLANNSRELATSMKEAGANLYKELTEEPILFGTNEGSAWSDAWGTRGIDVRVKRCSRGVEKLAGEQFMRYGYRTTSAWIEEPNLNVMTHFSYWQAEDVWLTAEKVNETNREIIRDAFRNGITVWRDPSAVKVISIRNNKIL